MKLYILKLEGCEGFDIEGIKESKEDLLPIANKLLLCWDFLKDKTGMEDYFEIMVWDTELNKEITDEETGIKLVLVDNDTRYILE